MLILLKADVTPEQQEAVEKHIRSLGYVPHVIPGATRTAALAGVRGGRVGNVDMTNFTRCYDCCICNMCRGRCNCFATSLWQF